MEDNVSENVFMQLERADRMIRVTPKVRSMVSCT